MSSSALCPVAPDFDAAAFRHALAQYATGVTVVVARAPDGVLHGLTVNSFSSVSLAPPLVLWSLAGSARSMTAFAACSHYLINVLAQDQHELALRFSRRDGDRFAALQWQPSRTGLPILQGAAAWFECRNRSRYAEGDHVIFVGEVERCAARPGPALAFHNGRFVTI